MKVRRPLATALVVALVVLLVPALALAAGPEDADKFHESLAGGGILTALGVCFVAGLGMSMTPCVWPMIPITVSIFGATESKSRIKAAGLSGTFVLGLVTFFGSLGIASALAGHAVGGFLGKWYVAVGIALVFAALAASMFGAFEIALPASLQNRLSTVGGVGFRGAYVLGLVMALIAAPCTTAFIAGLFAEIGKQGSVVLGFSAFAALALGMGLPFFVTGAFAMSLPKPGAWMLGVKWVCGVVLSYMALAYLRDAFPGFGKVVAHSGPLYGGAAIALAAIGIGLGALYIAAERRKSKIKHLSKPAKLGSLVPAIAGIFMVITWYNQPKSELIAPAVAATEGGGAAATAAPPITWLADMDAASKAAADQKKPLFVDFGAEWCAACKELEHDTFPDPAVRAEAVRFVSLHVDMTDDEDERAQAASKKFGVNGALLPAVLLIDSSGKEIKRFNGFVKPDAMAAAMRAVR